MSEANLACLLSIKVLGSSLKASLEQHYLNAVKFCLNDKNRRLNQKKRKIRKRKATKPAQKDFELLSLFETSSESELLSDNDVDVICIERQRRWRVCILSLPFEILITQSRLKRFCIPYFLHVVAFKWVPNLNRWIRFKSHRLILKLLFKALNHIKRYL